MARYIEKARKTKEHLIDAFLKDHPDIADDPRFAQIVYEAVKAMPRCQGTVRRTYMRTAFQGIYDFREVQREVEYGHRIGEKYTCLEISKKDKESS